MKIEVTIMNAFAVNESGGNKAGIVYNQIALSNDEKQLIAKKVGVSETVFINKKENNNFDVSFFTPNKEVDLCGHGTIAAFQLLLDKNIISKGEYVQITRAGILEIIINNENQIFMEQNKPEYLKIIKDRLSIAESLNISENEIIKSFPIQIVSTGLKDIMIGVRNNEILDNIKPNFEKILKISKKYQVVGYHVFSLEKEGEETANCRNFAPFYGIDEECATGTSSGALVGFLFKYNLTNENEYQNIFFLQGKAMGSLSRINAKTIIKNKEINKIFIGGNADYIKKIEISD
ncbi:MAG: PhzF family phenazine biosynthesis protein [Bacillota bacterium]|nr:PhzF family phenazine biosynthesis protein [Bacillota bacterium]